MTKYQNKKTGTSFVQTYSGLCLVAEAGLEPTTFGLWARRATTAPFRDIIERETGLKPATLSLEGWCSINWATPAIQNQTNWSCGQRWIRTTEVERQQIYSLPHLATLVFAHLPDPTGFHPSIFFRKLIVTWASCRIRTNDPEITNHVLWPTELKRHYQNLQPLRSYPERNGCKFRYLFLYRKTFANFLSPTQLFFMLY